jgi:ubiquinone/menaquinone biosynthesis C-methylase UbiE
MAMTKASAQYFDQVADQWDKVRAGYFTEALRDAAIAKAYLRPEMVVADVGAGTGFVAAGLAPLVSKVYVLDGSAAMLEVARRNLSQFSHIEYHHADGQSLPLPDGSVDAAFANMYLHHCPDPLAAIREVVRILKPGGRLVITDMDAHANSWFKDEMADQWLGFERDQVRTWFAAADLVNVNVDGSGQCCSAGPQDAQLVEKDGRTAKISVFLATGTKRIAMRAAVQQVYAAAARGGCGCGTQGGADSQAPSGQQSSCCAGDESEVADQDIGFAIAYAPDERAAVPPEAEAISLGCGNPIALANLRPGEVVLDIGSGGGMDAFLAAQRVGPHGKVIGVDMTPAMLERATRSARTAGIENVEFRQGQAEQLPVLDSSVNVILSNCVINLCEDKGLVFREGYRALKPGGRLEVSDVVTGGPLPLAARLNAGEWAGCVSGALPEREYLDMVAQAGFGDITVRRSATAGELDGVPVYSVIVSARKGRGSGCCG